MIKNWLNIHNNIGELPMRPMMMQVKKINNQHNLMGVEIGVKLGKNAKRILNNLHIKKIYLIDPYDNIIERGFFWKQEYTDCFSEAKNNLSKFEEKIEFIKKKSEYASEDVPDNLDFVYIDGNHTYKYVKKDIELYYPKIKNGGIIGGHDIWSLNVFIAILGFILKKRLLSNLYLKNPDWWIIKNKTNTTDRNTPFFVLLKHIVIWIKIFIERLPGELRQIGRDKLKHFKKSG
jgi:hypothetical protein